MNQGQYVFSQLVSHLDRNHFNYLARKYGGNKYVKYFSCWNQLLAMMFGQLSNRESLRDVVVALEAHHSKCKFLGIGSKPIAKTTLASANQNRDYRIFEDFAFYMMKEACEKRSTNLLDIPGKKYAFDNTHRLKLFISNILFQFWVQVYTFLWNRKNCGIPIFLISQLDSLIV